MSTMTIDNIQPHLTDDFDRTMPKATVRPTVEMTKVQRLVRKVRIGY